MNRENRLLDIVFYEVLWERLIHSISSEYYNDPYPGLRIARIDFKTPIRCVDCDLIVLAFMRLLIKYAYTIECSYGKFTMSYVMRIPSGSVSFTIGKSIPFREDGQDLPTYALIDQLVRQKAEEYDDADISSIYIRIYLSEMKDSVMPNLSDDYIARTIRDNLGSMVEVEPREVKTISHSKSKRRYPKHITALKTKVKEMRPFIVADTETILIDNIHIPYAVGFLVVRPGDDLSSKKVDDIETYFSEDYPSFVFDTFQKRSDRMLIDFLKRISVVVRRDPLINVIYFHNFSRFDGILILKHIAIHGVEYTFKPLLRNHRLYEVTVYSGKKLLFRLRDSLTLLPSSLDNLAQNLCPQLGSKGTITHELLLQSELIPHRKLLLDYMRQDIRLLGGVMRKVQEIYWTQYKVDIVTKLTLSSLALTIFRTNYYDPDNWPIHIPSQNEDTFIRRAYYGGHADVYKPLGENLYYYDVNSLYPYVMKSFPMPGGKPVWRGNLEGQDLDNMYGFIEAYVDCPKSITRPFLPYRDMSTKTIVFPTGGFVGVYYSEELKFARDLGYRIIPISGYMFENLNSSPFGSFVSTIFERRQEAKRRGNDAMSYVYKILMNSLYGRFGINPKCAITEICDLDRYNFLIKNTDITFADKLNEHNYIVNYWDNPDHASDPEWSPPRISAVQLAAAVTACARIHMYPYISREDCYYTDTDSVVLGSPLPEGEISSSVLGKFKLEHNVIKGIFLAPKSYSLITQDGKSIIKHKGLAKSLVDEEWFESQYYDLSRTTLTTVESNFIIDWHKLNIIKKETLVHLGIRASNKREAVFDNDLWVDTLPLDVSDFAGQDNRLLKYVMRRSKEEYERYQEVIAQKEREITDLESKVASLTSSDSDSDKDIDNNMSKLDSLKKPYQDKSSHGKKKASHGKRESHSAQKADEPTSKQKHKNKKIKKKPG